MLPVEKVERIELTPDFEIIYDKEKVRNIFTVFMSLPGYRNSSHVYLSNICLPMVRCINTLGNPLSSILNKQTSGVN
jgi:hypothetical protein